MCFFYVRLAAHVSRKVFSRVLCVTNLRQRRIECKAFIKIAVLAISVHDVVVNGVNSNKLQEAAVKELFTWLIMAIKRRYN